MKAKGDAYKDYILSELKKGNIGFEDVFRLMLTKFDLSRQTFSKYWKLANIEFSEARTEQNKLIEQNSITNEIESLKSQIVSSEQKKVILSQIFEAKIDVNDIAVDKLGNVFPYKRKPTASERMKAVEILNKMEGDFAPIKTENKNLYEFIGMEVEYRDI